MTNTTPVPHENPEWTLMAKALQGELSSEEQKAFTDWLGQEEANAVQWAEAINAWQKADVVQNNSYEPNVALAWDKFCAKAGLNIPAPYSAQAPITRKIFDWYSYAKYAAMLVLAAGLAWLGYTKFKTTESWTQMATLSGERKVIYLPDSSSVVLNENSTLRYQESFTGAERLVELTGEGFFEVKKNPNHPFIINSGSAQIKVLGTSFNLKALQNVNEVTVTVTIGKVSLASLKTKQRVLLTPGFTGQMKTDGSVAKGKTNNDSTTSWQALKYDGARLDQIEGSIESYFGIDITLDDNSLKACTFTGTFNQPRLKEILAVLAASNGLSISKTAANKYLISGNGCY